MSMALMLSVPIVARCCRIPVRIASLSLPCFLHAPAVSPRIRPKRFMLCPFLRHQILRDQSFCASCRSQAVGHERQIVQPYSGGVEQSVPNGRSDGHNGRLARASRWNVFPVEENRLDFGHIAESRHAISCKTRIQDATVLEFNGFEERPAETLNNRANNLIAQTIRIDNGAAFERFGDLHDAHATGSTIDSNFSASCDITTLLKAAGDPKALTSMRFLLRPAEGFRSSFQNGAQARV